MSFMLRATLEAENGSHAARQWLVYEKCFCLCEAHTLPELARSCRATAERHCLPTNNLHSEVGKDRFFSAEGGPWELQPSRETFCSRRKIPLCSFGHWRFSRLLFLPHDYRRIPTFVAGILQTTRDVSVIFYQACGNIKGKDFRAGLHRVPVFLWPESLQSEDETPNGVMGEELLTSLVWIMMILFGEDVTRSVSERGNVRGRPLP